jgi:hypothetical protein
MSFVSAPEVTSPKNRLSSIDTIVHDDGKGSWVVAALTYDEEPRIGMRWNGTDDDPLGYPSVRNYPVWFIVPDFFAETVKFMAEEKAKGRIAGLPLSTEALAHQLKSKGYRVTLEM